MTQVLTLLMEQDVVHVDETLDFVGTKRSYFHVIYNELFTLLHADVTRGKAGTERAGLFPDYNGIAVHDRLAQYFSYDSATHAICCAHLIHDLASVSEIAGQDQWTAKMTALLLEMKLAGEKREMRERSQSKLTYSQVCSPATTLSPNWLFQLIKHQLVSRETILKKSHTTSPLQWANTGMRSYDSQLT